MAPVWYHHPTLLRIDNKASSSSVDNYGVILAGRSTLDLLEDRQLRRHPPREDIQLLYPRRIARLKSFSSVIRLGLSGYLVHLHLGHQRHKPREEGEGEGEPIMIGQSTIKMEMGE